MVVDSLSNTLSAVSDPTRRAILRRLAQGPATVGQLAHPFSVSQQAVSKHVAALERANLVAKRRQGRTHICTLNPGPMREVAEWAESFRHLWERRYQRLDELLEELQHNAGENDETDP